MQYKIFLPSSRNKKSCRVVYSGGSMLIQKVVEEAKNLHFTEIECYSPETHSSSWKFYEKLGFMKHGIIKDPNDGYPGMLWRKIFS